MNFKTNFKKGIIALLVFVAIVIGYSTFEVVSVGEKVRIQNTLTGNFEWHVTEGTKLKVPFFSNVATYTEVNTIAITDDDQILATAATSREPMHVNFVDNYGGTIEATFRVKLPSSPELLEQLHQDVKSMENLQGNTFQVFVKDMISLTVDQFLAQDFMQGGKGAFKQRLTDQSQFGMLVTKRERTLVEQQVADQKTDASQVSAAKTAEQFISTVVIQEDPITHLPLRRAHSLAKYGIEVVQVDLGEFHPDNDLVVYIGDIKKRERERATVIASQSLERDKAVTEQLKGDRERITAKNKLNIAKDAAVIVEEQKTAVIKEQGKQAIQQKLKEQGIATANLKIEEANALAAVYQGKALKEVGFAEAAVIKEKYAAVDPRILAMEVDRDKSIALYKTSMVVNLPTIVNSGSSTSGTNPLDQMSSLKVLEMLGKPITTK